MKRFFDIHKLGVVLTVVFALFVAACSDSSKPAVSKSKKNISEPDNSSTKKKIYIILKESKAEYWQIVLHGARNAAEELNVELIEKSPDSESDIAGQSAMLDDAIFANPAAIVLAPSKSDPLVAGIEDAVDKGIPVIIIDSKADTDQMTAFLASDNLKIGTLAADEMAKAMTAKCGKPEGKIACITFLSGAASLEKRKKGFEKCIKSKYPGIKIVEYADAKGTRGQTFKLVKEILEKNKELKGLFVNNQTTGDETVQALKELGRKDLAVVVVDSGKDEVWGIKNGFVDSMVVQKPWMIGYMGVDAAVRASKGEKLDKFIDTGIVPISPAMIKDGSAEEFLNPIEFNKKDASEKEL